MAAASTPPRQSPGSSSGASPRRSANCRHRLAKCPVSYISTRSPGDKVLTRAASQAPVPEAGKMTTGPAVLKIRLTPSSTSCARPRNSGAAVVDGRFLDGAQHPARYVGRSGNLQQMTTARMCHGSRLGGLG